jgi:hypothetical protein
MLEPSPCGEGFQTNELNPIYQLVAFEHDSKNFFANGIAAARSKVLRRAQGRTQPRFWLQRCMRIVKELSRQSVNAAIKTTITVTFPAAELKERPTSRRLPGGRSKNPAITYSRVLHTTIGPGCLTAVFGMGTGVTIQVCSPESCLWRSPWTVTV